MLCQIDGRRLRSICPVHQSHPEDYPNEIQKREILYHRHGKCANLCTKAFWRTDVKVHWETFCTVLKGLRKMVDHESCELNNTYWNKPGGVVYIRWQKDIVGTQWGDRRKGLLSFNMLIRIVYHSAWYTAMLEKFIYHGKPKAIALWWGLKESGKWASIMFAKKIDVMVNTIHHAKTRK